jgi:hypothetical protein
MYPGSVFHVTVLCRPDQDSFYDVDVSASQFVSILDAGNAVYEANWSGCHGLDGRSHPCGGSKGQEQFRSSVKDGEGPRSPRPYGSPCHTAAVPMQQVGLQQLSRSLCSGFSAYTLTLAAAAFTSYSERSGKLSILSASFRHLETIPGCGS